MPPPKHSRIYIILWSCLAVISGIALTAGIFSAIGIFSKNPLFAAHPIAELLSKGIAKKNVPEPTSSLSAADAPSVSIPAEGKAIRIDLENGAVALYETGRAIKNFSAVSVPDALSPWRIPQGTYAVRARKEEHYSPLAGASFKEALLFGENGLIRTETSAELTQNKRGTDAEKITNSNNGGQAAVGLALPGRNGDAGIALASEDATTVFNFADTSTKVIVLNEVPAERALSYEEALLRERSEKPLPRISARAALVADIDSGEIFFEKASDEAFPIASITKLFTALVAEELLNQEEKVVISREAFSAYGGNGGLAFGEAFSAGDLLYPLLIESSNDAAEALAEKAGREKFIRSMNALADDLGLSRTSFVDPSGLSPKNASTAQDLFRFAQLLADEHEEILAISKMLSFELPSGKLRSWARTWRSNNEFVRDGNQYLIGSKNGYTDEAFQTTLSLFALPISETKEKRIAVILLGSSNREGDALALLGYGGKDTLYGTRDFANVFRKKAEAYAKEKEKETPEFRLAALGTLRHDALADAAFPAFENLLYLKSYDAVVADILGVVADTGYNIVGSSAARIPAEILPLLATLGVDVVNVANAHAGDWGRSAYGDYIRLLKESGFRVAGGSDGFSDRWEPVIIERGGVRVGFLNVSDAGPEWLSEDDYLPSILSAKDPLFSSRVRDAARGVDHLIVSVTLDDARDDALVRREVFARATIDLGARVVVGFSSFGESLREEYKDGMIFYGQRGVTPLEIVFDKKGITK